MPIIRTIKNYLKAYLAKGAMRFMSQDDQIVYMILNCSAKKIAKNVLLPASDYVAKQIVKQIQVKSYGKTWRGTGENAATSVVPSMMGAPAAAMTLEALKRVDVKCIVRVDYCGGLTEEIQIGDVVLANSAICGDGTTPHYLKAKSEYPQVDANLHLTEKLRMALESQKMKFHQGPIWTHDALFVEPPELVEKAKDHGAIAIDMETSVIFALGELFNIPCAAVMVVTDNPGTGEIFTEKTTLKPSIFQNLDKVIAVTLDILSKNEEEGHSN
jgi:uridine phosphorylase